jgi:hypothetical protein
MTYLNGGMVLICFGQLARTSINADHTLKRPSSWVVA